MTFLIHYSWGCQLPTTSKALFSKYTINIISFNLIYDPMRQVPLLTPFYR